MPSFQIQKVILDILTRALESREDGQAYKASELWMSAWLISCFPALSVSFLFDRMTSKMNDLEISSSSDLLTWSRDQIEEQGAQWNLSGEIHLLAYSSTESASYWAHSLSLLLEESTAPATLLSSLLFFGQGTRTNAWILLTAWRRLLQEASTWSEQQKKQSLLEKPKIANCEISCLSKPFSEVW